MNRGWYAPDTGSYYERFAPGDKSHIEVPLRPARGYIFDPRSLTWSKGPEAIRREARLRLTEIDRESVRSLREAILAMHGQASMTELLPRIEALEAEAEVERRKLRDEERRT